MNQVATYIGLAESGEQSDEKEGLKDKISEITIQQVFTMKLKEDRI
jgi:hypothetical protein